MIKLINIKSRGIINDIKDCNVHIKCKNCNYEYYDRILDKRDQDALDTSEVECPICNKPMKSLIKADSESTLM
jgi:Zn finger protein HypA/HybF involved in hydrogenase expression